MVPGDEAGIFVPAMFRKTAIARGCIPVGMEPNEAESDALDRTTTIRSVTKRALATVNTPNDPTRQAPSPRDTAVDPEVPMPAETTNETAAADNTSDASLGGGIADAIMRRLQQAGETGLRRSAIRDAFGRNLRGIGEALEQLRREGRATRETLSSGRSGGRPPEVWRAVK
jgi:predicted component of type VI protein secretion system